MPFYTLDEAANKLKLNSVSLFEKIIEGSLDTHIHALNYKGFFIPKKLDVDSINVNSDDSTLVTINGDVSSYMTSVYTTSDYWQLDKDCAEVVVSTGSYHIKHLVPSKEQVTNVFTSPDEEYIFYILSPHNYPLVNKSDLLIKDSNLSLFLNKDKATKNELHTKTKNKYLELISVLSTITTGNTDRDPKNDAKILIRKFESAGHGKLISEKKLIEYLTEAYSQY